MVKKVESVERIQFFDIDGVLTDPTEKKVNLEVLDILAKDLERGIPIVLVTGRGWEWVRNNLIDAFTGRLPEKSLLEHVFVSVEKGGIYLIYKAGQWVETVKAGEVLPEDFLLAVESLTGRYSRIMSRKESKQTMYSVEMHRLPAGTSQERKDKKLEEFQKQRDELKVQFERLLEEYQLSGSYEVDSTTIALDIQPKGVGKRLGTREAIDWLKEKGIQAKVYEVFGDSVSDVDMAFELAEKGFAVKLIYVGDESRLEGIEMRFERDVRDKMYDKGTVSYLRGDYFVTRL